MVGVLRHRTQGGRAEERPRGSVLSLVTVVLAVALQLVVLVPFTVASGLLAPLWAVVALHGLWLAAAFVLLRTARRRPLAAPLVPVANGLLLWLALTLGELWLGWTA
jgi:hypothetical protein